MKRPSFQWYPADWRNNAKLRRCSWAARGVWIDVLGFMHDSDEYGILRWPLKEIVAATGAPRSLVVELAEKHVMYGVDKGLCEAMWYQAVSGRRQSEPVLLVPEQNGPIWYSPRMVRDEYVRSKRGAGSRFGDDNGDSPNRSPMGGFGDDFGEPPNNSPTGRQGDGSTSTSTSTNSVGNSSASVEGEVSAELTARATAAAVVLRKLGMLDVTGSRAELIQLLLAGATLEQLQDTAMELAERKAGQAPKLAYLAATMFGRAADLNLSTQGGSYAPASNGNGGGKRQAGESAAGRAERKQREADARDDDGDHG